MTTSYVVVIDVNITYLILFVGSRLYQPGTTIKSEPFPQHLEAFFTKSLMHTTWKSLHWLLLPTHNRLYQEAVKDKFACGSSA